MKKLKYYFCYTAEHERINTRAEICGSADDVVGVMYGDRENLKPELKEAAAEKILAECPPEDWNFYYGYKAPARAFFKHLANSKQPGKHGRYLRFAGHAMLETMEWEGL